MLKWPHRPMLSERVRTGKLRLIGSPTTGYWLSRDEKYTKTKKPAQAPDLDRQFSDDKQKSYFALYSLAVNSLWPTDCACLTVPFGAFASSGHHR